MALNRRDFRTFHRRLYGGVGCLEKVTLLKRNDDQGQGTVNTYTLFQCRWSMLFRSGETIQGEMLSSNRRTLHIPRVEMDRVGVHYINPLDRFVDKLGRTWQPEAPTLITAKLLENHICVDCLLLDGLELHG